MALTRNSGVATDSMAYLYAPSSSFHLSALPASPPALSDLAGFDCNIGPSHSYDFHTKKQHNHHPARKQERESGSAIQFPPSPPPTNSDPKRNVPLPSLSANGDSGPVSPFSSPRFFLEDLHDSSALMKHAAPLTPPPTLPTPTLPLPLADGDNNLGVLSPIPKHDELELESSLIGLPPRSPGEEDSKLLYPLSLEWTPAGIAYEMSSPPSPTSPPFTCNGSLLYGNHHCHHRHLIAPRAFEYIPHPHGRADSNDTNSPDSQSRPILPLLDIPECFSSKGAWSESPTSTVDTDMDSDMDIDMDMEYDDELELDLLHTPTSPPASPFLRHKLELHDLKSDDLMFDATALRKPYESYQHQHQHQHQHPCPSSPPVHQIPFPDSNALLSSLDMELDDLPIPSSPSPSLRSFAALPTLSPDEDPYPSFYSEDDDEAGPFLPSPPSPGPTLLALPGADTDDDLLPADLAPSPFPLPTTRAGAADTTPTPRTPYAPGTSSLLLLDDPDHAHAPTDPDLDPDPDALDDLDVDVDVAGSADPDVRRLGELRRRCVAAERAARDVEVALLERGGGYGPQGQGQGKGQVQRRWEARRVRKREKEKGREVGAMLRLKLGAQKDKDKTEARVAGDGNRDGLEKKDGEKAGRGSHAKGPTIRSMEQLVAKMLLRRNDTSRSLANRRTPVPALTGKLRASSPLVWHATLVLPPSEDDWGGGEGEGGEEHGEGVGGLSWTSTSGGDGISHPLPAASVSCADALPLSAEMGMRAS